MSVYSLSEVDVVGIGARTADARPASGSTLTFNWPTGYTPTPGHIAIVHLGGWGDNGGPTMNIPTGYTGTSQSERNLSTTQNLCTRCAYKILDGSESAPSITVQADFSSSAATGSIILGYVVVFSGGNPFDRPTSSIRASTAGQQTFQPYAPGVSAVTNTTTSGGELIVSFVVTGDSNTKTFSSAQSFTEIVDNASTAGTNISFGAAIRWVPNVGASYTMCTWNQSSVGGDASYDSWATVSMSIPEAVAQWGNTLVR